MEDQIQSDFELLGNFIDHAQMKLEVPLAQSTAIYNAAERLRVVASQAQEAYDAAERLRAESEKLQARVAELEAKEPAKK